MKRNFLIVSRLSFGLLSGALLASCVPSAPLPTASSIEMAQTAVVQTQIAPPAGFEKGVQFPRLDDNLTQLPYWRYRMTLSFEGTFADTQEKTSGQFEAEVFRNELLNERRVLLKATGAAFGFGEPRNVEGVRLGNDYFLVNASKVCSRVEKPEPGQVADLSAGAVLGGIKLATPGGGLRTETGVKQWNYAFAPENVIPPPLQLGANGKYEVAAGDLWVAPSLKAVAYYTLTLNIERAIVQGNRPLTGQLRAVYQLVETGVKYNISIPFGC